MKKSSTGAIVCGKGFTRSFPSLLIHREVHADEKPTSATSAGRASPGARVCSSITQSTQGRSPTNAKEKGRALLRAPSCMSTARAHWREALRVWECGMSFQPALQPAHPPAHPHGGEAPSHAGSAGRASARAPTCTSTAVYTSWGSCTVSMSAGRASALELRPRIHLPESPHWGEALYCGRQGRASARAPNSSSTRESTLGRSPMSATNVGRASARAPTSTSTSGSTGKTPTK